MDTASINDLNAIISFLHTQNKSELTPVLNTFLKEEKRKFINAYCSVSDANYLPKLRNLEASIRGLKLEIKNLDRQSAYSAIRPLQKTLDLYKETLSVYIFTKKVSACSDY